MGSNLAVLSRGYSDSMQVLVSPRLSRTQRSARDLFKSLGKRYSTTRMSSGSPSNLPPLIIHLRDINATMVKAWKEAFKDEKYSKCIKASVIKAFPYQLHVFYYIYMYRLPREIYLRVARQQMLL